MLNVSIEVQQKSYKRFLAEYEGSEFADLTMSELRDMWQADNPGKPITDCGWVKRQRDLAMRFPNSKVKMMWVRDVTGKDVKSTTDLRWAEFRALLSISYDPSKDQQEVF